MLSYLARRLLTAIPTLLIASFLAFSLGYFGPGDPVWSIAGMNVTSPEHRAEIEHDLGLDRPFLVQYGDYVTDSATGDFGVSWIKGEGVGTLIGRNLPVTLQLAAAATLLVLLVGLPLGVIAALRRDSIIDRLIVTSTVIATAIPTYVMAPILLIVFVLWLGILPVDVGWDGLFRLEVVVPVIVLMLGPLVIIVRQVRSGILEAIETDYVQFANARGLTRRRVMLFHVLPNAMTPLLSQLGLIFGSLLTGAIFVERIFGIPGFGNLIVGGIQSNDMPLLMGSVVVAVALIVVVNLITDLLYRVVDPRVRIARTK